MAHVNTNIYSPNSIRRKQGEELILTTAEQVFADSGFEGATVTEIAKRANIPKANIHYYFTSKIKLYERVIDDVFQAWLEAAEKFEDFNDPEKALTAYIHAKMDLSRSRPNGSKVWANEILHGAPIIHNYLNSRLKPWLTSRETCINRWISEGYIRPVNARFLMYMIWACTQHYADFDTQISALNNNKKLSDIEFEQAKKTVTEIILFGLQPRS